MSEPPIASSVPESPRALTLSQCGTLACLLESIAPKAGNVHRGADFEDLVFTDFAVSGVLLGPLLDRTSELGVGQTIWKTIEATQHYVATNTNLGIILLLAPLAAVPREQRLVDGIGHVLQKLTRDDARYMYQAIAGARSRALGRVESMDVSGPPPASILEAMNAAADRDLIARQYVTNFETVLNRVLPWLIAGCEQGWPLTSSIVHAHVRLMSEEPDSLIARKCGHGTAEEAASRAATVLDQGGPKDEAFWRALGELDFWLRCDGNRRNPGTSADLMAAGLFAGLREGQLRPPWR